MFTLLSSGILPLEIKSDPNRPINEWYGFFALAFVAGFSERLVKDIISQTENKVSPTSTATVTLNEEKLQKDSSFTLSEDKGQKDSSLTSAEVKEQKDLSKMTVNLSTEEQKD